VVRFGVWLVSHRWQAGITHSESRLSHHGGESNKPGYRRCSIPVRRCPLLGAADIPPQGRFHFLTRGS
jgi:hypothetical protein